MANVEFFNGYEIFPLCGNQRSETIGFNEIVSEMSDGYTDEMLYGAVTGNRAWSLTFNALQDGLGAKSVTLNGLDMTAADYVWDLFCRTKVSGVPFIVTSPKSGNYYLARFAEPSLTYDQTVRKLFSTGLKLTQVRKAGVSVFNIAAMNPWGWWKTDSVDDQGFSDGDPVADHLWADDSGNGNTLSLEVGATYKAAQQNGKSCVRLNGTSGYYQSGFGATVHHALLVVRVYEAAWSNLGGVLTAANTEALLVGNGSGTIFYDFSQGVTYEKGGIEYAESAMASPMNEFALVHIHYPGGISFDLVQIGKDRSFAGRFAKLDFGEIAVFDTPQPRYAILEAMEDLTLRWGL